MNDSIVNYPEIIISKSTGQTITEKYLSRLCKKTFLSFWSFPNVFKDEGIKNGKGDGKELCDLLVVFGNHILIFSDKDCAYPKTNDPILNWSRWCRRAIIKSAQQIWMAEKWLLRFPERIFIDKECITRFPIAIPCKEKAIIHRIVVAHSASEECKKQLGGTGSLMIIPQITGEQHISINGSKCRPFAIGHINPSEGYVHVFDDTTLNVVMSTLDTISDFVEYLTKKEIFIRSNRLAFASGEDDLLAYYLHNIGNDDQHDFILEDEIAKLSISEGLWTTFIKSPQRIRQIESNKISYSWDKLIEKFLGHIEHGTSYFMSHPDLKNQDSIFRILAKENRTRRRILAESLIEMIRTTPKDSKLTRTILPSKHGDPYYVFILLPKYPDVDYKLYREARLNLLQKYCLITRLRYADARDIIGIATETGYDSKIKSEDCIYFDGSKWDETTKKEAEEFQDLLKNKGLLSQRKFFKETVKEYPDPSSVTNYNAETKIGRNQPCICGSGIKFKKCCGKLL